MKIRFTAEFTSDLPDDFVSDGVEISQYGGESVAKAIAEMLRALGCAVEAPFCLEERGWELVVLYRRRQLMCRLSLIEGYVFTLYDPSWFKLLFPNRHHPIYLDLLGRFGDALAADARFHHVRWQFEEDVLSDKPGAPRPIED